jgi:hypothetical protein
VAACAAVAPELSNISPNSKQTREQQEKRHFNLPIICPLVLYIE